MKTLGTFLLSPYKGFSAAVWRLFAASFINSTGLMLPAYITLSMSSLNYSTMQVGLGITLFGIGAMIGSLLGGLLAEKYPPLAICKCALILVIGSLFLFPLSHHLIYLYFFTGLCGFSTCLFRPALILVLTHDKTKRELTKLIALRRVSINLGMAFGGAFYGLIAAELGYHWMFWLAATANIIAYIALLKVIPSPANIKNQADIAANDALLSLKIYAVLFMMFIVLVIFDQTQSTFPLYIKNNLQLTSHTLSMLFLLNGIMVILLQMPISDFLSKQNTNLVCAIGALLVGTGFAVLPLCVLSNVFLVISCMLWTLGEIIFFPTVLALIIKISGKKKGRGVGAYQLNYSLSMFIAPLVGTHSYMYNENLFWYLSGALGVIVCTSFLAAARINHHPAVEAPASNAN